MRTFPKITVSPDPSLFDEPLQISVEGADYKQLMDLIICAQIGYRMDSLRPLKLHTVYAYLFVTEDCIYESFANYKASSQGIINVTSDTSLFGSYIGIEPMGLLWSMTPYAASERKIARFIKTDVTKPQIYHLKVFNDEKLSLEDCRNAGHSNVLATKILNRWCMAPGVRRIPVEDDTIVATLFLPSGKGPFPGLINIFGGYPGILEYKSALHASHGFASLALAYVGAGNLPKTIVAELDLEYFEKAVQYMKNHDSVQGDNGIGVFSICKGAQIGIMMATYLSDIRCVVAINGSCMSGFGTFRYKKMRWSRDDVDYSLLDPSKDNHMANCAILPEKGKVEEHPGFFPFHKRHHVSYMLVLGLRDTSMPTYFGGEMERLLHAEKHPDFVILKYADSGHLIEPPYFPFCEKFFQSGSPGNVYLTNGGILMPHCKSQEDSWPKMLNFLKSRLSS